MSIMTAEKVETLNACFGNYPHTQALKKGDIKSDRVAFRFTEVEPINKAFLLMVRQEKFDVSEMAIATYLQAKAYGKPMTLIPATMMGRFQHGTMFYNAERGTVTPENLAGRRVGVRSFAQTTGCWMRGILWKDYGLDLATVKWVTFEDAHLAEFRDPPGVERAADGKDMTKMVLDGELDAAIFGTVLSTVLIAGALFGVAAAFGIGIPIAWCLVFGALISPTDPVAVLLVLRRVGIPQYLQAIIAGESLFNDGIAVVLFTLLLSLATGSGDHAHGPLAIAGEFLLSAVGGGVLGLVLGYAAFLLIRGVDDYNVELIISLALVTGTYSLAGTLDVSGPVAVVVAGILMGNHGMQHAMSEPTRQHLKTFWLLVDDTLNALLFLLIGLAVAAIFLAAAARLRRRTGLGDVGRHHEPIRSAVLT